MPKTLGRDCGIYWLTHSSRKAWHTIYRLTSRTASIPDRCPVSANAIASQLLQYGRFTNPGSDFSRLVGKEEAELWKVVSKDVNMSTPFTTEELVKALKSMKVGKAPGPDDIHPEFLLHAGDITLWPSGCVSIWIPVWKDVKSQKSGVRQHYCHRPPKA